MDNNKLAEVFVKYEDKFNDEPQYTIDFVKANEAVLKHVVLFDDKYDIKKYVAIIGRYIKSLVDLGRYNLAIDEAEKYLPLIEKERLALGMKETDDNWYLTIRFQQALAHFNLKDYKIASTEFKELQKFDPHSDHLKQWTEYARIGRFKQNESIAMIIAVVLIVGSIVFRNHIPGYIRFIFDITGVFLLLFYFWIDYKSKRNKRKK